MARPALAMLGAMGARYEVLARDEVVRVFEDLPGLVEVHVTARRSRRGRLAHALKLRERGYDAALVLAPSFSAALAAFLTGARIRVGERGDSRDVLLTHPQPRAGREVHLELAYRRVVFAALGALGARNDVETLRLERLAPPLLRPRDEERQAGLEILRRAGVRMDPPPLVVAPGALYGPAKRYPPARFARAAELLATELDCDVVLVGTAADASSTAEVCVHLRAAHDLAGVTGLGELLGVLAESAGVLSNDSGTMHLAAALGKPVVGVFGSTNPAWTGPIGPHATFIAQPVFCSPCYDTHCKQNFECMLELSPERVAEAFREVSGRPETRLPLAGPRL
jgi:heptosyltransferase-2